MAGIYIHIPFCYQRCHYCDFYKTTELSKKTDLINALTIELSARKSWIDKDKVKTIYFGGGTPSLLSTDEIKRIIDSIYLNYQVDENIEITLESNPDDLTQKYINNLAKSPINRLSIGIQSFQNDLLKKMNRRHNSSQAIECVQNAQEAGFTNISTDLIYGIPDLTMDMWMNNLEQMGNLNIQHLSAYHLTIEPNTAFGKMFNKGALNPIKEDDSLLQFKTLIEWAKANNFDHYEISNFAKDGLYSQHNTSYWQQQKYLGIGPSAHSYNINSRLWNIANLDKYLTNIQNNISYSESEILTDTDKYNEFLMTWLRTKWGINLNQVKELFGDNQAQDLLELLQPFIKDNSINIKNGCAILSDKGIFISDLILSDLMLILDE